MRTLAAVILMAVAATDQPGVGQKNHANSIEQLNTLIKTGSISRVELLRLPDYIDTRVSVSPKALRAIAYYKVSFNRDIGYTFEPLLSGLSAEPENHTPDLRWGVLFYDSRNDEVGSIFVDRFGNHGYLNGKTVSFHTGILNASLAQRLHAIIKNLP